jgi:hypothetical protein
MLRKLSSLALVVAAGFAAGLVACSGSNGGGNGGVDAPSTGGGKCGDGVCAASEVHNCPMDCGVSIQSCGDGVCDPTKNETTVSCPKDCGTAVMCGDGVCDVNGGETSTSCPADCGTTNPTPLDCRDMQIQTDCGLCVLFGLCAPDVNASGCQDCTTRAFSGVDCDGGAPDGTCAADENTSDCFSDCFGA